jgi:hypothetical protein
MIRKIFTIALCLLVFLQVKAQLTLTNGAPSATIDFSTTIAGVNNGGFAGSGFSPSPAVGQLNSNGWAITGFSDGSVAFGGTGTTGDFARGSTAAAVTTGGVYSVTGLANSPMFMVQPAGSDFNPGTLTLRITNGGSSNITQLDMGVNLYQRNDQGRSSTITFSVSLDNSLYIPVPAFTYTTPVAADALGWVLAFSPTTSVPALNIAPGSSYYIRATVNDAAGAGSRDEIGFDNLSVSATFAPVATPNIGFVTPNSLTLEGNLGTQSVTIPVSIDMNPAGPVVVDVTVLGSSTANGADYSVSPSQLTFNSGPGTQNVTLTINGDVTVEPTEYVNLQLSLNSGTAVVNSTPHSAAILNDDIPNLVINEFVADHVGADTYEYVEVFGTPNTNLTGWSIIEIEADAGASTGFVDRIMPLTSTDVNGFDTVIATATENGSLAYYLVQDMVGTVGQDLDVNNDGILDIRPWTIALDSISKRDVTTDVAYTPISLDPTFGNPLPFPTTVGGASRLPNGQNTGSINDWVRNDFEGAGLPGFTGGIDPWEGALNTPMTFNQGVDYQWDGSTSTDWFDATNWVGGTVPPTGCVSRINIPVTGNDPVIAGSSVTVSTVTIDDNVTLTLNGVNLSLCDNWIGGTSSPSSVLGTGELIFNGANPQVISGINIFTILTINNASGVSIGATDIITGVHLQAGNLGVTSGLTLLSPDENTAAYIDDFTAGFSGTITGDVTIQREVAGASSWQHFVSSPIDNALFNDLTALSGPDGVYVIPSSNCSENLLDATSVQGTAYEWDEAPLVTPGCYMGNWKVRSAGNMDNGQGYSVYMNNGGEYDLNGTPNSGNITVSGLGNSNWSTNSAEGNTFVSGWHLLGNPFPSPMHLESSVNISAGWDAQVQVWQPSGPWQGTWQSTFMGSIGADANLAEWQGFQVHNPTPGSTLNFVFEQSDRKRTSDSNPPFYFMPNQSSLDVHIESAAGKRDRTKVFFNTDATAQFDQMYDADKLMSTTGYPTLYTWMPTAPERHIGVNTLTDIANNSTVPMAFIPGENNTFTISADGLNTFDPTSYIYLEDLQTGTMHNLRTGNYTFAATTADAPNRFVLHFTPAAVINTTAATCNTDGAISINQPGTAVWTYAIADAQGVIVASGSLSNTTPVVAGNLNTGTYTLTLTDNSGYTVVKNIAVSGAQPLVASFTSPVNISAGQAVTFNNTTASAASIEWNMGDGTIITGVANPEYVYTIPGQYTVTVTVVSAGGCTSTYSSMVTVTGALGLGNNNEANISIYSTGSTLVADLRAINGATASLLEVYNALGQLLFTDKLLPGTVYKKEVQGIAQGYLFVKIISGEKNITGKLHLSGN